MGLCHQCISDIMDRMTPYDVYILNELRDKTTAQLGANRDELSNLLGGNMSIFQISQSLLRLELVGFVGKLKSGRVEHFHITANGLAVLGALSKQ